MTIKMSTKIFVGNLSFQATEQELQDFLSSYGEIEEVFMPKDRETGRPRGFAFVTFTDDAAAQDALRELNGKEFAGRELTVNEARPKENGGGDRGGRGGFERRGGGGGRGGFDRGGGGGRGGFDRGGDRGDRGGRGGFERRGGGGRGGFDRGGRGFDRRDDDAPRRSFGPRPRRDLDDMGDDYR